MERVARLMYCGKNLSQLGVTQRTVFGFIDYDPKTGEILGGLYSDSTYHSNNIEKGGQFTPEGLKFTIASRNNGGYSLNYDLKPTKDLAKYEGDIESDQFRGLAKIVIGHVTDDRASF